MTERELTNKQLAFVDYYIETLNATQAYMKAYPNITKETTASANGSRLLGIARIRQMIDKRLEELQSKRVADQQEILEILTSIARGEKRAAALVGLGGGAEEITQEMPPTMSEITKAAELLGKRYALWTDKQQVEGNMSVTFVDDIGDGDET